jgi:diguanylate cyclase (GGDEF)-like protein
MCSLKTVFLGALTLLTAIRAFGSQIVELTRETGEYPLSGRLEILEDRTGNLSISDAREAREWRPSNGNTANYGLTASVYWARFQVADHSDGERFLLELGFPSMDSVKLFLPQGETFAVREAGDFLPFSGREVPQRTFLFNLPTGVSGTVYLRFQTKGTMTFPLTLWSFPALLSRVYASQLLYGAYWGLILGLFFYNLFLLISIRDMTYCFYLLYVLFFFLFQFAEDGFGYQYLWPAASWWANKASPVFLGGTLFSVIGFTRFFTSSRSNASMLDKGLLSVMGLTVLFGASVFIFDYRLVIIAGTTLVFATGVLITAAGVFSLNRGNRPARFFVAAWAVLILTACVANAEVAGFLSTSFSSMVAVKVGTALQLVLFSLSLADRINAMKIEKRSLERLATMDSKTQVYNFFHFDSMLQQEVKRSLRYHRPLSLIMVDVDNFKRVNDEFGHKAGDEILKMTATVLRENCRDVDLVARFGGDEFVVMLPETVLANGLETAAKLRGLVESQVVSYEGAKLTVTISLGVANIPAHAREKGGLIEAADKALYLAKETGKNRVRVMEPAVSA